jgi:acyl carrier protein
MTEEDILDVLNRVLRDLLSDDSIVLKLETKRDDVANWDSFAYISFIVGVEAELGVRFGIAEIESFENVGAIVRRVKALLPLR